MNDKDIISGIHQNMDWAVSAIYKTQYASVKKMVFSFRNMRLEPEDIFQEGLTRAILNIRAGKFREESSLATYLHSICRNICLKLSAGPNPLPVEEFFVPEESTDDNYFELLTFINKIKSQMPDSCREIIDLRFNQSEEPSEIVKHKLPSFEEIALKLNITVDNARQRFKRCLDQLRDAVFGHPEYHILFDLR